MPCFGYRGLGAPGALAGDTGLRPERLQPPAERKRKNGYLTAGHALPRFNHWETAKRTGSRHLRRASVPDAGTCAANRSKRHRGTRLPVTLSHKKNGKRSEKILDRCPGTTYTAIWKPVQHGSAAVGLRAICVQRGGTAHAESNLKTVCDALCAEEVSPNILPL